MSDNMEIKTGQIWRNVHGEVEIADAGGRSVHLREGSGIHEDFLGTQDFLATHEFVRDPKPEIKVGDWVISRLPNPDRPILGEVTSVHQHDDSFVVVKEGALTHVAPRAMLTPCDPPPLHKALREALKRRESGDMMLDEDRMLHEILDLYRKGER